ncbi:hypothetical protein Tco_0281962 [Tanacetum coccineum]
MDADGVASSKARARIGFISEGWVEGVPKAGFDLPKAREEETHPIGEEAVSKARFEHVPKVGDEEAPKPYALLKDG